MYYIRFSTELIYVYRVRVYGHSIKPAILKITNIETVAILCIPARGEVSNDDDDASVVCPGNK